MKSVIINIDDDIYNLLERYSFEHGEDVSVIALRCCVLGWSVLASDSEVDQVSYGIEDWKRERGFGKYGRRKTLSHSLR